MMGLLHLWKKLWGAPPPPDEDVRESRLFFVIVTLVLGAVMVVELRAIPALRAPICAIPFVALMVLHIALYWVAARFAKTFRRTLGYLAVQTLLVFILTQFLRDFASIVSLYPSLLGIAVGMLRERRRVAWGIVIWLALATFNLVINLGFSALPLWLMSAPPLILFVVIYVVLYLRQVEARDRAQALLRELETAHRELSDYAGQVEALTLVAERQRMARELHDTLAQGVAGLILQLEAADSHLAQGRAERAQGIVQQAMSRARATLADARRAIDDLRVASSPPDLVEALRCETTRFTDATGIPCAFDFTLPDALSDTLSEHVQRIVSECLTNVARHAQATQAWVKATGSEGAIVIEVGDDGVGFDPVAALGRPGHYGLLGMRERARLAGGTLDVKSAPGAGARVVVTL